MSMFSKLCQPEVIGIIAVLVGYYGKSYALEPMQTCMDKHGSTYSASSCYTSDGQLRDVTPEYMYTDRETQRLQMVLNNLSAQALENIARAGTPLPDISSSYMNNTSNSESRSNSDAKGGNSRSKSGSSSNSNSSSSNVNRNEVNSSVNSTNVNVNGIWN